MFRIVVFIVSYFAGFFCYFGFASLIPPKISVVMSTYNRAHLLPHAVESILNQSFKDFEFIIIDDGSTDNTAQILSAYKYLDKRVKVLTNEKNRGLVYSLNRGLKAAKGKYIARMDDDDISMPWRFEYQVAFMDKNPHVTVSGTSNKKSAPPPSPASSHSIGKFDISDSAIISYFNVPIFHPTAMIRKDFLTEHNIFYDNSYPSAEDTPFWHTIVRKGGNIVNLPYALVEQGYSGKTENYFETQLKSFNLFLEQSLDGILPAGTVTGWVYQNQACFILNAMKRHIGNYPYFTIENINHVMELHNCPNLK